MLRDEIEHYSIDELELISETQENLYSEEEMKEIRALLQEKINKEKARRETFIKERLPDIINCSKCDGPNEFANEVCKYCGSRLEKKAYYYAASIAYDGIDSTEEPSNETEKKSPFLFHYIISFLVPLVGFIIGGIRHEKKTGNWSW